MSQRQLPLWLTILILVMASANILADDNTGELVFSRLYKSDLVAVNVLLAKGASEEGTRPKLYIEILNRSLIPEDEGIAQILLKVAESDNLNLRAYIYSADGSVITNTPSVKVARQDNEALETVDISLAEGQKKTFEFVLDLDSFENLEKNEIYQVHLKFRSAATWKVGDDQWERIAVEDISFESELLE